MCIGKNNVYVIFEMINMMNDDLHNICFTCFHWLGSMECAIGRASRAMALPNFKVVGPVIHLVLPNCFFKIVNLSKYFH